MPTYPHLKTFKYQPNPELAVRPIYAGLGIQSILDVGAGHGGVFDLAYWQSLAGVHKEACDIHWIKRLPEDWKTTVGVDACELTKHYEPKSFDMVQCMEVLEHIPDSKKALEEMCKVARKFVLISSADEMHHIGEEQDRIEKTNRHQRYVKQPSTKDLEELGFTVRVEETDRRQIVAWRVF